MGFKRLFNLTLSKLLESRLFLSNSSFKVGLIKVFEAFEYVFKHSPIIETMQIN